MFPVHHASLLKGLSQYAASSQSHSNRYSTGDASSSVLVKESEFVDFDGRQAMRKDIITVNNKLPLCIVLDSSKVIRSGADLPSSSSIKSYPKNLLPNHAIFKIISYEVINYDDNH